MKLRINIVILMACAGISNAATTITITNFSFVPSLNGTVITDMLGNTLPSWSYAVGTFQEGLFVQNGSSFTWNQPPNTNTFNIQVTDAAAPAGSLILGLPIVVAIGENPLGIASSQRVALIQTPTNWIQEDPVLGGSQGVNIDLRTATLVPGTFTLTTPNNAGVSPPFNALSMAIAIPEPSAALLGLVGALGLLRRRRN